MPQGTVKTFDPTTGTAVVLDDSLRELAVPRQAFMASGLLELRLGQRVRFELEGDEDEATIGRIDLITF